MKRLVFCFTIFALLTVFPLGRAFAQDTVCVQLDGEPLAFDVEPQIVNGRVMLPVRAVFEAMGMRVDWDEPTQTAIGAFGHRRIFFTLGSDTAWMNDLSYTIDTAPVLADGRMLIPVRFAAECLGYTVNWYEPEQTVYLETPESWVVPEPIELTLFLHRGALGAYDYNNMTIFQEADRKTNIKLTGTANPNNTDMQGEFKIMLTNDPLPDIVQGSKENLNEYGMQGAFIPLEDLVKEYAPHIQAVFDEHPEYVAGSVAPDGHLYFIPGLYESKASMGFYIRKDWLDKLGLEVPTTVDEYYNVLKAFREQDPNGNGLQDEIPYFYSRMGIDGLLQLFGAYPSWYVNDDDEVVHGATEEAYKTAMKELIKWYKEGLIDQEIYSRGWNSREWLLGDNLGGSTHDWFLSTGSFNRLADTIDGFEWVAIAPPADVNGVVKESFSRNMLQPYGWGISIDNQYPIETIKYFDWWFSEEGRRAYSYGIEGDDYTMADGEPQYTEAARSKEDGLVFYLRNIGSLEIGAPLSLAAEADRMDPASRQGFMFYSNHPEWYTRQLPDLNFTEEEKQIIYYEKGNAITTLILERQQEWLYGRKHTDATWETYLAELDALGYQEVRQIYQNAYDRYLAAFEAATN